MANQAVQTKREYHEVTAADLPLHCPRDGAEAWSMHPRVFLAVDDNGDAVCPYCGAVYHLHGSAAPH